MIDDVTEDVLIENLKKIQQMAHSLRGNNELPKKEIHLAGSIVKIIETQLATLEAKRNKRGKK